MPTLEERVRLLESRVHGLLNGGAADATPWWDNIRGTFRGDPHYDEAMRLGREWRETLGSDFIEARR